MSGGDWEEGDGDGAHRYTQRLASELRDSQTRVGMAESLCATLRAQLAAAQQEVERLKEALETACQAMTNAHYRLSNPTMDGEHVPRAKEGLKMAKNVARAALASSPPGEKKP